MASSANEIKGDSGDKTTHETGDKFNYKGVKPEVIYFPCLIDGVGLCLRLIVPCHWVRHLGTSVKMMHVVTLNHGKYKASRGHPCP